MKVNFSGGLSKWKEDGTALIPNVAGYALGKAGNEVGGILSNGVLETSSYMRVGSNQGIYGGTAGTRVFLDQSGGRLSVFSDRTQLSRDQYLGWSSTADPSATPDIKLHRIAANTLGMYNGAAGQALELYNTRTDASNYEQGFLKWVSNVMQVGTGNAGTGVSRNWELVRGGVSIATVASTGLAFVSGKSIGLNGSSPPAQAAHITDPTADVAALKTAVDAILVVLENLGATASA